MYRPGRRSKTTPKKNDITRGGGACDPGVKEICELMKRAVNVAYTEEGVIYLGPRNYEDANTLTDCFIDYIDYIKEAAGRGVDLIPDVEGFCTFAGISRKRFMELGKKTELYELTQQILTAIAAAKKQRALSGGINPVILAMDLNNNHGYSNTNNTKIDINGPILSALPSKKDIIAALPVETTTDHGKTDQEPPKTGL